MNKLDIKIKKMHEDAVIPTYGTEFSAGADLYALLDAPLEIKPGETVLVHTGLSMEITPGFGGFIFARSGLASKKGLAPANKVGVVDSDYRGEIMVALHNHSDKSAVIECGERIAQMVFLPYAAATFTLADALDDTARGEGGFGSTGNK